MLRLFLWFRATLSSFECHRSLSQEHCLGDPDFLIETGQPKPVVMATEEHKRVLAGCRYLKHLSPFNRRGEAEEAFAILIPT